MPFPQGPVALIVNPAAGRAPSLTAKLPALQELLRRHGCSTRVFYTTPETGSAERLGREASANAQVVLACGGDGTVHQVIQGVAGTHVALGVLPLGTANVLARDLHLPLDPVGALGKLLTYTPVSIPLGELQTATERRLFAVMAGCGPDGALAHALTGASAARAKARFGRSAYYAHAARLFVSRSWPMFHVEHRMAGSGDWQHTNAVAVIAARVPNLGGVFRGLTRRSGLQSPTLTIEVLRPPGHLALAAWFSLTHLGLPNPFLRSLQVEELRCSATTGVYAQADAEPMGLLPVSMRVIPDALRLLMPAPGDRSIPE